MKDKKGITLISLIVTIVVILIIVNILITALVGEQGLISRTIKAKKEYETSAELERVQLENIFNKNYVDYNGELKVVGNQLLNQYGEKIQLRGFSTSNGDVDKFDFQNYYNNESIQSIKELGSNLLRLVVLSKHYVNGEEALEQIYKVINCCIKQDIYVIID